MKTKPVPNRVIKQLDDVIAVWTEHEDFSVAPDVTLKKLKDARSELASCAEKVESTRRQLSDETNSRNDCAKAGNELVVRTRKAIAGYFGLDAKQYAQAGGTRSSERKSPVRKLKVLPKAA